ncbi:MAG: orotidine 5'-phosphate decarboxylase [Verrucomicrobia bacterium]|nr:orotidine 5'-phosphate decarboxylase [Verrucomicrobiota bacterium]
MTPPPPLVQLALDFPTVEEALAAAEIGVAAGVDILEAGTPLIVARGAGAIGRLARAFPSMPVLADYKTMDSGFKNVQITRREGGHYMTVCANAADETVRSAIEEGRSTGIRVVTDTIGVKDPVARSRQCVEWGVDMIYLHFAADQRRAHPTGNAVAWVAPVCEVAGRVPVGMGCFGVEDAVRGVRAGASLVAIGHPLFSEPDFPGALRHFVEAVKSAR